jgi:hypothetical protein
MNFTIYDLPTQHHGGYGCPYSAAQTRMRIDDKPLAAPVHRGSVIFYSRSDPDLTIICLIILVKKIVGRLAAELPV